MKLTKSIYLDSDKRLVIVSRLTLMQRLKALFLGEVKTKVLISRTDYTSLAKAMRLK